MRRHLTAPIFACLAVFGGLSVMMVSGATLPWDEGVLRWVGTQRTAQWIDAGLIGSFLADGTPIAIVGFGFCGILWARAGKRVALAMFLAAVVGELIYVIAKASFARGRPAIIEHLGSGGWHAYPSGHTMLATLIWGSGFLLLAHTARGAVRALFLALALALPLAVGASRVVLGVHYPSDVLAGLALGAAGVFFWRDWSRIADTSRSAATS